MEKRARQYEDLKEQINHLKKQFLDIAHSGDEFQGKGAEAIKGFYSAQADVAEAWIRLIDKNIALFKGVEGDTEDAKLSGSTFVQLPFLEENIPRAQDRAREMVEGQQHALGSILRSIDDLISLPVFSADAFEDHMAKAEKERNQTIDAVNQLDQTLTEEYALSEYDQQYLAGLFGQLLESSRQGNSITPVHFDAKAYKNSDIYKMKSEIENSSKEYLEFKAEQAEARKKMKIAQELEARPWYEKAWDTTKTFTGEVTGYYDYKRATEGVDPVTGEKLSEAKRISAGAMATAGVVPIVGWAGRAFKGGAAIYKSVKAYNGADHALDAYKTSKSFSTLQKAEMGIYGLISANGLGEAVLGKDMFGNPLTDQQRQQSLLQALGILGIGGAAYGWDKLAAKNGNRLPFSNQYVNRKIENAHAMLSDVGKRVGSVPVPVRIKQEVLAGDGINIVLPSVEYKSLSEIVAWAKGSAVVRGMGKTPNMNNYGDQYTKVNGKKVLKSNIEYTTIEGYHYKTDSNGRISSAEAKLQLGKANRNQYAQRKVGGKDRLSNDDGGHLIASIFKGSGEIDNLVPMNATLNRSEYKILENTWKKAIIEGKEVTINVKPIYVGKSIRPIEFKINYKIDGKKYSDILTNYTGGKTDGN